MMKASKIEKNLLSLFSGCGGMDLGFEGGFKAHKSTLNVDIPSFSRALFRRLKTAPNKHLYVVEQNLN